ncbi:MAG TPA: YihY/virulence factor BrkB family protein [Pseudonocardiaceae bacterium]|nr:YihY/virulence factor BrkB family protein [Pseudonocardiaceae bacterium]
MAEGGTSPEDRSRAGTAERPTQLPGGSWWAAVKRTVREFQVDNLKDWAAALTYYSVLSIFPALVVLISLIDLAGRSTIQTLLDNLGQVAPGSVNQILEGAIRSLQQTRGSAGVLALAGLAAALWSASNYIAAFMRASNAIYDVPEGRPVWKTLPIRIAVTVLVMVLLAASAVAVVATGGLADRLGRLLGLGSAVVTIWDLVKWPVLLLVVSFMFALLYWASPNAKQGFRWVTPGGILAVVVWVAASVAFAIYVANFNSYNKTYGSLASVIIFLVWLWLSNTAILLGAELNAELERSRAIAAGHPPDEEPYMELRDTRKLRERDNL